MPLHYAFAAAWPLFFGLTLMMAGSGLQGTLLGVRATEAGFDPATIGIVMSVYYAGYMLGTWLVPRLLKNVGHIRVFTALAAIAASAVLMHGLFVTPAIWIPLRIMTGFAYAGLYIVVESWLNSMSTKDTRGKILALYLLLTYLGMVAGQFCLNLADPKTDTLFICTAIFIILSLVPIALSKRPAPEFHTPDVMPVKALWSASPLGVFAIALSGLSNSIMISIGSVYATERGFDHLQVSWFMASMLAGGVTFQIPIGHLSDIMDRRRVLTIVSFASAGSAFLCALSGSGVLFYASTFLLGGFAMTIYGLCLAYTNDHLQPHQYVASSSSMLMMNGMGAILGPLLATNLMKALGTQSYFPAIGTVFLCIGAFAIYRATRREAPAKQAEFHTGTPDPRIMDRIDNGGST